jgi:hypothetical protein
MEIDAGSDGSSRIEGDNHPRLVRAKGLARTERFPVDPQSSRRHHIEEPHLRRTLVATRADQPCKSRHHPPDPLAGTP